MAKTPIVFATNNAHKLEEARAILGARFEILSLQEVGFNQELPETGNTLQANALQKLQFFTQATQLDAFSDDTGLEVTCLNGLPGVDTAHYSGTRDAQANMAKLLKAMDHCEQRDARFVTVIACAFKGQTALFEGEVRGKIARQASGNLGFGYDPVFIPESFHQTFADLPAEIKNQHSHRARAMQQLASWLLSH